MGGHWHRYAHEYWLGDESIGVAPGIPAQPNLSYTRTTNPLNTLLSA